MPKDARSFKNLTTEELVVLWEELTINLPYLRLLRRYAQIACTDPQPTDPGDRLALKVMREFECRDMTPPIPEWMGL